MSIWNMQNANMASSISSIWPSTLTDVRYKAGFFANQASIALASRDVENVSRCWARERAAF